MSRPTSSSSEDRPQTSRMGRRAFFLGGCACCVAAALPLSPAVAQSDDVRRHLDIARQAAGSDLTAFYSKLSEVAAPTPGARSPTPDELMKLPAPPPGQAFDNLCFVGSKWVSCWALKTSDGIILIDAMDNADEAERIVAAGLRREGLNPADIKTIIVTHGHGDHYGGVDYLKTIASPRVVMSAADWTMTETRLDFDRPDWGRPPKRDVVVADGDTVVLGDTKVDILLTPGHTMGTLSLLFDVRQGGRSHRALLWGGTGFNFGRFPDRFERLAAYIASTERTKTVARQQQVDVFLSNHNHFDEAVSKLEAMKTGAANPFIVGQDTIQRILTVMNECARATEVAWRA